MAVPDGATRRAGAAAPWRRPRHGTIRPRSRRGRCESRDADRLDADCVVAVLVAWQLSLPTPDAIGEGAREDADGVVAGEIAQVGLDGREIVCPVLRHDRTQPAVARP